MTHKQKDEKIEELTRQLSDVKDVVDRLDNYLTSDKFHCGDSLDNYVCCYDVLQYTQMVRNLT